MMTRNTVLRQFCRFSVPCLVFNLVFAIVFGLAAHAADVGGPLTVTDFSGAVKLKMDDRWQDPQAGMTVRIPATVSTGADGSIDLLQDGTTISIAANTALELLPGPTSGQLVKRIVQSKGSTFYDVAKREHDKLRVETPYLVAVIKGTQFNVTVAAEGASVALFEGLLHIDAPDIGDSVELEAGHIARRQKGDTKITVLRMDDGEPLARTGSGAAAASGSGNTADANSTGGDEVGDLDVVSGGIGSSGSGNGSGPGPEGSQPTPDSGGSVAVVGQDVPLNVNSDIGLDGGGIAAATGGGPGGQAGPVIDVYNELKIGGDDLGLEAATGIDAGALGVDVGVGAGVDLGSGDIGLDLDASVDVADAGVDLGVGADVDLGSGDIGLDVDAGVDVADAGVDLGVGADVDLGSGDVGLDVDAGVDVADTGVDAGVGADVDLGSGDIGLDVDAGVDVADAGIDIDAGADVDLGSGDIGLDLGAGGVGAGIDVDTGLDGGGAGLDVNLDLDGLDDVTGVLDDLLGGEDTDPASEEEEEDEDPVPLLPDLGDLLGL
ncbi:MAG: FecR domain-containing protein [Woeseiaceae bacterium]